MRPLGKRVSKGSELRGSMVALKPYSHQGSIGVGSDRGLPMESSRFSDPFGRLGVERLGILGCLEQVPQ